ncbi:MAG: multicopper oxidase family protein [Casimicrobiaceae bacterium]
MKRRTFIGAGLAGIGGALFGCNGGAGDEQAVTGAVDADGFVRGQPLRQFDLLRNESQDQRFFSASLSAAAGDVNLIAGRITPMLLYNQRTPGPLIELREGQRVRIELDNQLAHETTIHWHGLPIPSEQDGNPMDPVPAGTKRVYDYVLPQGCAGTYWYHPHPHNATAEQVVSGLAGPLLIRAAADPLAHVSELCLFISGVRLGPDGRIEPHTALDWAVGRQPDTLLVNGARVPRHTVRPGTTQRWRIVNATAAHHFRLALEGHQFTLVGTDGGLLGAPVAGLSEILIAPAQRVEVLVTIDRTQSAQYRLRALRYQTDVLNLGNYADDELMTVATTSETPESAIPAPAVLRPIADLGDASVRQRVELTEVEGLCTRSGAKIAFLINGRIFDANRIDLTSRVGQVELWDIVNLTGMAHPFHVHGTQFQLVSRQLGQIVTPAPYLAWVDTVLVPPQHSATIKIRQDFPGKRMFHCHILEHEDNCMMAILDVLPHTSATTTGRFVASS